MVAVSRNNLINILPGPNKWESVSATVNLACTFYSEFENNY